MSYYVKYNKYKNKYLDLKKIILNQKGGNNNSKIRIIAKNKESGIGINKDIMFIQETCKNILEENNINYDISIVYSKIDTYTDSYVNINFYIEHLPSKLYNADKSYFFVNQEFLYDWDIKILKENPDITILCKTHYAEKVLDSMKITNYKYIGFGNPEKININNNNKIQNSFLHIAGKSALKNTKLILDTWIKYYENFNNAFLILTTNDIYNKFYLNYFNEITNNNYTLESLPKEILDICPKDIILPKFFKYKNIYYYSEELDSKVINFLINLASCILCPSAMEGWGHYIDEARRANTVILTLNAPPMNELITKKSGILVKSKKGPNLFNFINKNIQQYYLKTKSLQKITYTANKKDLADNIIDILKMSDKEKQILAKNALKKSKEDYEIFYVNMKKLLL